MIATFPARSILASRTVFGLRTDRSYTNCTVQERRVILSHGEHSLRHAIVVHDSYELAVSMAKQYVAVLFQGCTQAQEEWDKVNQAFTKQRSRFHQRYIYPSFLEHLFSWIQTQTDAGRLHQALSNHSSTKEFLPDDPSISAITTALNDIVGDKSRSSDAFRKKLDTHIRRLANNADWKEVCMIHISTFNCVALYKLVLQCMQHLASNY